MTINLAAGFKSRGLGRDWSEKHLVGIYWLLDFELAKITTVWSFSIEGSRF